MTRTVTITDEESVVVDSFEVSNKDALKIAEDYSTDWMEKDELESYLADGDT